MHRKKGDSPPWTWILDSLLLFALATALIRPLYKAEYLSAWNSIESTFIADARFLSAHWPHPGWNPNWYTGTRFDYIYPPALRYGTALLSRLRHTSTARSYHLYIALLYAAGIAGVYVFARAGSRSRWTAAWAAVASAVVSPAFLLFRDFRLDYKGVAYMPLRLGALIRYGEGPHISSMAVLPFALAASWIGLRRGRPAYLALASILSALVVAHNFYGASALAMLFPIVVWSIWLAEGDGGVWIRAAVIAVLAYGLSACWLTPSYLRVTLDNMRWVSEPGHAWSAALGAVAVAGYAALSWRFARDRPERAWASFCLGTLGLMALDVAGNMYFDFRVIGEPGRLIPELEVSILLATALFFAWLSRRGGAWRVAAMVLACACLLPGRVYVPRAWKVLPPRSTHQNRVEFALTDWIHRNLPGVRTLATGSIRFWYNAWYDLPELGGGSEQGLLNPNVQWAYSQAVSNDDVTVSIAALQAMGTGAVITHDQTSQEIYHDWAKPLKFDGSLEKIFDNGRGDRIYRVPLRNTAPVRVVETARALALQPTPPEYDAPALMRYLDIVEHGPAGPAEFEQLGTDGMRIRARLSTGQSVLVQESFDTAWRCYSASRRVPISRDALGFMLLDPGPGEHDLLLRFETPLENRAGAILAAFSGLAVLALFWAGRR